MKSPFHKISLLILLVFVGFSAIAQKEKKKKAVSPQSNEMRLREAEFFFTEGEKYFMLEDYTKALLFFQRVIELNPENPTVYYKNAEILSKSNKDDDLERAALSIENALRLEKKNKYFYLLASNIYNSMANFSKAEQVLETMMKEINGTEEYLYELAAIYQYDKKPDEAVKVYNRAESVMGINEVSSLQKLKIFLEAGKINEAIEEGEKLMSAYPDEERYAMGFAETLAQKGQVKRAVEIMETYLVNHPEAGTAKILLAGFYRQNGQEVKARELLKAAFLDASVDISSKVIVLSTYNTLINQNHARSTTDSSLESFALDLFDELKANYDDEPNVHVVGGDLYIALRRNDDAQREYIKAIQKGTSSFEAWQNLLGLQSEANQFDSLIVYSERGMEVFPNQGMLYYFNGYAHIRKKHYRDATTALEQAKRLSSSNPAFVSDINGMLGDAYNGTKEYGKSDASFDEALSFNPNNDFVLNNYSYFLALRKENLEKAERMAGLAVKNEPNNSSYLDTYAWVLYMREKYKEAKKVMERAMGQPDVTSTHFEHYGDILFQLGEVEAAVKQWEKARSMTSQHDLIDKKIANRRLY